MASLHLAYCSVSNSGAVSEGKECALNKRPRQSDVERVFLRPDDLLDLVGIAAPELAGASAVDLRRTRLVVNSYL